ncbi:MAG: glycosyltransferase family 4 protein [Candidatus Zixiibacteriota bacterium]
MLIIGRLVGEKRGYSAFLQPYFVSVLARLTALAADTEVLVETFAALSGTRDWGEVERFQSRNVTIRNSRLHQLTLPFLPVKGAARPDAGEHGGGAGVLLVGGRGSVGGEMEMVELVLSSLRQRVGVCLPLDVPEAGLATGSVAGFLRRVYAQVKYLRKIVARVSRFRVLHVFCGYGESLVLFLVPVILIGRFFGKQVILDYQSPVGLYRRIGRSRLLPRLWRVCDRVVVPSVYLQQLVNSFGGRAFYQQPLLHVGNIVPRVVSRVQPHLAVCTDLEREHNVACAIRAFELVKRKYPRTELTIVGVGRQRRGLESFVLGRKLNGVHFVDGSGYRERQKVLASADVYVNCSSVDFLSAATIEAFASGLPVVSTPCGGGGDVWRDRRDIMRVDFNHHTGVADRIIELVEDPALTEMLSRRSVEIADRLIQKAGEGGYSSLYRDLIGRLA